MSWEQLREGVPQKLEGGCFAGGGGKEAPPFLRVLRSWAPLPFPPSVPVLPPSPISICKYVRELLHWGETKMVKKKRPRWVKRVSRGSRANPSFALAPCPNRMVKNSAPLFFNNRSQILRCLSRILPQHQRHSQRLCSWCGQEGKRGCKVGYSHYVVFNYVVNEYPPPLVPWLVVFD